MAARSQCARISARKEVFPVLSFADKQGERRKSRYLLLPEAAVVADRDEING